MCDKSNYNTNPKYCKYCQLVIPFNKRKNIFCSQSCSASYNNQFRSTDKLKETWEAKKKPMPSYYARFPYSTIFHCNCQHCGIKYIGRNQRKYCTNCDHLYSHDGRAKYWFTFNMFLYPDLFNLDIVKELGMYNSKTNPNGITRDHRVSVNEAIRNNYDPYYIKHPLNCELMTFVANNKKKAKSSISYSELIQLVDSYETKAICGSSGT